MTEHRPDHEVELFRDGNEYVVVVDLPGYDREDLDVRWHDRRLHVHAERGGGSSGRSRVFNRQIGLPHDVDADGVRAVYEDGVLEVTLPIAGPGEAPGTRVDVD